MAVDESAILASVSTKKWLKTRVNIALSCFFFFSFTNCKTEPIDPAKFLYFDVQEKYDISEKLFTHQIDWLGAGFGWSLQSRLLLFGRTRSMLLILAEFERETLN